MQHKTPKRDNGGGRIGTLIVMFSPNIESFFQVRSFFYSALGVCGVLMLIFAFFGCFNCGRNVTAPLLVMLRAKKVAVPIGTLACHLRRVDTYAAKINAFYTCCPTRFVISQEFAGFFEMCHPMMPHTEQVDAAIARMQVLCRKPTLG